MIVKWSGTSRQKLFEFSEFIALDSLKYALEFIDLCEEKVKMLESFPKSGRIIPEFSNQNIRELIV